MTKRRFALLCGCIGFALGYGLQFLGSPAPVTSLQTTPEHTLASAPKLGERIPLSPDSDKTNPSAKRKPAGASDSSNVRDLMTRYNAMSPQELEDEFRRISTLMDGGFDPAEMPKFLLLVSRLGELAPKSALDLLGQTGFQGMMLRPTLFRSWIARDPENAVAYYNENKDSLSTAPWMSYNGSDIPSTLAREWAQRDLNAALNWVNTLPVADQHNARTAIIADLAKSNINSALEQWNKLPESERSKASSKLAQTWALQDPTAAMAWINSLPEKDRFMPQISALQSMSLKDIDQTALYVNQLGSQNQKDDAIRQIGFNLASKNPQAAIDWISAVNNPKATESFIPAIASQLTFSNPTKAVSWIESLPSGSSRDQAVMSYAHNAPVSKSQQTLDMLGSITNVEQRNGVINHTVSQWMRSEPDKAKAWLQSSNLVTPEQRDALLKQVNMKK